MRDFRDAKAMAVSLREALAAKGVHLTHGECLELVSRQLGAPDWNTLSAMIKDAQPRASGAATKAETEPETEASPEERARRLAEQQAPRTEVPFDPARFDRFVGHYQRGQRVLSVTRDGGRFFSGHLGQDPPTEFFAESDAKFFAKDIAAQISFVTDTSGAVTEHVIHQNGRELRYRRIDEAEFQAMADALAQRVAANAPSPGAEEALRRHLESRVRGEPDFDLMVPSLAAVAREQWPRTKPAQAALGALKSIDFVRVGPGGWDEYRVAFEHGVWLWMITPPGPDGKVWGLGGRPADEAA